MTEVKQAALEWVEAVIREQLPAEQQPRELASSLCAIAENQEVPIEAVVQWLNYQQMGKEFSPAAFARWASNYADLAAQVLRRARQCAECGSELEVIEGRWFCASCGVEV